MRWTRSAGPPGERPPSWPVWVKPSTPIWPNTLHGVSSIRFGVSRLPPGDGRDAGFLDEIVEKGHRALELPFVDGFPWKEKRCQAFGELAAERDIRISVHAPYFA